MPTNHVKGVKAHCPKCLCEPEKIEYWNCGPIVRLRCPICWFVIDEIEADERTLEGLVGLWNKKGMYCVHD